MDAFFASVEERERPYLQGQPIAVGSDPQGGKGRGVVSTANYPARAYGVRSATPISKAWELSEQARKAGKPPVVFITPHFPIYESVSREVMAIVAGHLKGTQTTLFTADPPALEQVSVDECYVDLSFAGSFKKAEEIAVRIKKEIAKKERLSCSIGIGPNKLIAKIASDFKKPDGLTVITEKEVLKFLEPMSVRKIPGIGQKAEEKLARVRVRTARDGRKLSEEKLRGMFGKWGKELFRKFWGEDDSPVVVEAPPAKSIGEQETLPEDSLNMKILFPYLERQAKNLVSYLTRDGFKAFRTVVLTVRFSDFETVSRSRTLQEPISCKSLTLTDGAELLRRNVTQMFFPFLDKRENPNKKKIRLLGVRIEKLN